MGILLKNVHLLDSPEQERTDVYVNANRIAGIGKEPRHFAADEIIDGSHKTLMPGLINCHTHSNMSIMRNYSENEPFEAGILKRITAMEDAMTPEEAYWGSMLSVLEMIRTGTTTFVDQHMFSKMAIKACADSGMRAVITRAIIGQDRNDETARKQIEAAFDEMAYAESLGANCTFGLGPHSIDRCGEDLLAYVTELAHEKQMLLNIHAAETEAEFSGCLKEHGCTPVEYLERIGMLDEKILLSNCVYLQELDFWKLSKPNVSVVTNPASNMKLANGFAPVQRMMDERIRVCLGTDSAESNHSLNMFSEMKLLAMSQKAVVKHPEVLTSGEVFNIATKNGAEALGLDEVGSIEVGKSADLVLVDENWPNLHPLHNRKESLVYSATGYEVSDVLIGGKIVMKDCNFTTIDAEKVYYKVEKIVESRR